MNDLNSYFVRAIIELGGGDNHHDSYRTCENNYTLI